MTQIRKTRVIAPSGIIPNQQFHHRAPTIWRAPTNINPTDFGRRADEITVVKVVIVQLLMGTKGFMHPQNGVPGGIAYKIPRTIARLAAKPLLPLRFAPSQQPIGFRLHSSRACKRAQPRYFSVVLTRKVGVVSLIPHRLILD